MMLQQCGLDDVRTIEKILCEEARDADDMMVFFETLILSTNWPKQWQTKRKEALRGKSKYDGIKLVNFALPREVPGSGNPKTAIGGIVKYLIDFPVGAGQQEDLTRILLKYDLI
jgi:hypothetical protein